MKVKSPKHWTQDEFETVHVLMAQPGWKIWEEYVTMRLEQHKDKLVDEPSEDIRKQLIGRIKEARTILKALHLSVKKDAKRREKSNKETNQE